MRTAAVPTPAAVVTHSPGKPKGGVNMLELL